MRQSHMQASMFVNSNANISVNASKDQDFANSVAGGGKLEQKTKKKTNPDKQAFFEELRKSKPPTA